MEKSEYNISSANPIPTSDSFWENGNSKYQIGHNIFTSLIKNNECRKKKNFQSDDTKTCGLKKQINSSKIINFKLARRKQI